MAEPLPPVEHAADAMKRADEAIAALKRTKPSNAAQARARSAELMTLQQTLLEASRKVVAANAQNRIASSNGHASAAGMSGFTEKQVETTIKIMATALAPHFDAYDKRLDELECKKEIAPLTARLAELEAHLIKLEQAPTMRYEGVWDAKRMYAVGDFTTHDGSLWACCRPCTAVKPGSMEGVWTLAVKRGKDGKVR